MHLRFCSSINQRYVADRCLTHSFMFLAKLVPVGYGIKKLQIGCVVEDEKVGIVRCRMCALTFSYSRMHFTALIKKDDNVGNNLGIKYFL